jgi:hypothetical protein
MPAKKPVKKGYHRMPDGSLMKDSDMKKGYGKKGGKPTIVIAISMGKPKKSAPKRKGR